MIGLRLWYSKGGGSMKWQFGYWVWPNGDPRWIQCTAKQAAYYLTNNIPVRLL